jgi:hypothetical protein
VTQRRSSPGGSERSSAIARRRTLPLLLAGALAALSAGALLACQDATRSSPPPNTAAANGGYAVNSGYAANPGAPPPEPASANAEGYLAQAMRQLGSAQLFLPGSAQQQQVTFETVNGQAIMDGDILLGSATALLFRYGMPRPTAADSKSAVAVASQAYLWPNGEIPYVIDASAQGKRAAIDWAVQQFSSTSLRVRPRTAADPDYVVFRLLGQGCLSNLGRVGGAQDIDVTTCAGGNLVHELLHAAGFYHEQSRGDRDQYISIMWDEIVPAMRSNFEQRDARGQDIGPYDYGSIMHYGSTAFSRSGRATIIPRQTNVMIGQREGFSALDRAAVESLYGTRGSRSTPAPAASAPTPAPSPALPSLPLPVLTTPMPAPSPTPAPTPTPVPAPPSAPAPAPAATANASFTGSYGSSRGTVNCSQGGVLVNCQYPGGTMFCAASGPGLTCTWSGGGQGRASFQRQANGVLAGSWGDGFSAESRGRWDLTPAGVTPTATAAPTPSPAPSPTPLPAPAPAPAPSAPAAVVSLTGNYQSSRGPMACTDAGASVSCNFQESDGTSGRLDCAKSQNGLELSCAWITFLPRPATGRALLTRQSASARRLTGTWGLFLSPSGAGTWEANGQ